MKGSVLLGPLQEIMSVTCTAVPVDLLGGVNGIVVPVAVGGVQERRGMIGGVMEMPGEVENKKETEIEIVREIGIGLGVAMRRITGSQETNRNENETFEAEMEEEPGEEAVAGVMIVVIVMCGEVEVVEMWTGTVTVIASLTVNKNKTETETDGEVEAVGVNVAVTVIVTLTVNTIKTETEMDGEVEVVGEIVAVTLIVNKIKIETEKGGEVEVVGVNVAVTVIVIMVIAGEEEEEEIGTVIKTGTGEEGTGIRIVTKIGSLASLGEMKGENVIGIAIKTEIEVGETVIEIGTGIVIERGGGEPGGTGIGIVGTGVGVMIRIVLQEIERGGVAMSPHAVVESLMRKDLSWLAAVATNWTLNL